MTRTTQQIILFFQIATFCAFAGRAYQHIFWDAPYREVFWDAAWMQGVIENFTSMTWHEYVTHPMGDVWFRRIIKAIGVFYALAAIGVLFIKKLPRYILAGILWAGSAAILLLALVYTKDHFFHVGQFFEFALQFGSPIFLYYLLRNRALSKPLIISMKIAIALTFACHGLYAIGYYPRPANYMEMTIRILGISQDNSIHFLNLMGLLDMVVAVGIFLPNKISRVVLAYAAFWGLVTALARVFGNFYWQFPMQSLHQWVFETVYRLPHGLIPLALYLNAKFSKDLK